MEVIINGIRYVPATDAAPSMEAIARGLMMHWWGVMGADWRECIKDMHICVNDDGAGPTFDSVLADIADQIGHD